MQAARVARTRTAEHPDQVRERVLLEMHRDWKEACKLRNKAVDKQEVLRAHMMESQAWQQVRNRAASRVQASSGLYAVRPSQSTDTWPFLCAQGRLVEQDSTEGLCQVALVIAAQGGAQKRQEAGRGWSGQVATGVPVF